MFNITLTEDEYKILLDALRYLQSAAKLQKNIDLFSSIQNKLSNATINAEYEIKHPEFISEMCSISMPHARVHGTDKNYDNKILNHEESSNEKQVSFNAQSQMTNADVAVNNDKFKPGTIVYHRSFGKGEIVAANRRIIRVDFSGEVLNFNLQTIQNENIIELYPNDEKDDLDILINKSNECYSSDKMRINEKIALQHRILMKLSRTNNIEHKNSLLKLHLERLMNLYKDNNNIEESYAAAIEILKYDPNNHNAKIIESIYNRGPYYSQRSKATDFQYLLWSGKPINNGNKLD